MSNPQNKNATIEYKKFVLSSLHSGMKTIFDTFLPFNLFKDCLEKKEKDDQSKVLEEKKKKEGKDNKNILNSPKSNLSKKDNDNNMFKEGLENDSEESDDPFDITKDYDKVFNFNLITDEEKDEFRKGKPHPYLKNNLLNIISKKYLGTLPSSLPKQEQNQFQLISFKFRDSALMRYPNIHFIQNKEIFDQIPDPQINKANYINNDEISINSSNITLNMDGSINQSKTLNRNQRKMFAYKSLRLKPNTMNDNNSSHSSDEEEKIKIKKKDRENDISSNTLDKISNMKESSEGNSLKSKEKLYRNHTNIKHYRKRRSKSTIKEGAQLKEKFFFKTENGQLNKFIKYNKDFISYDSVKKTLDEFSLEEYFPPFGNKIAIPSDSLRQEIFIFDPIYIDLNKGALNSLIVEDVLKKRAKLLFPYKQNFVKNIIIKLIQFLFIIKYKLANKKNLKNSFLLNSLKKKNGKTKLKEIEGSNIITFSDVKPFMKSLFGHFNLEVFKNAYEKKRQKNEEIKRAKKMAELQRKFLDILQKDDLEHQENEEDDNIKREKRRNDANPLDIEKDSKMLFGAVYKPRKKMNYLDGLKMLIKEESTKNKGTNLKYQ